MFDFLFVAEAVGVIDRYFHDELTDDDFWEIPNEWYQSQELQGRHLWFTINPAKLKEKYRISSERLVVTQEEKNHLLKAFQLLHKYSDQLPTSACFSERLLVAKNYLPPVFFEAEIPSNNTLHKECRIIPLFKK